MHICPLRGLILIKDTHDSCESISNELNYSVTNQETLFKHKQGRKNEFI